ncbi:MAG: SpoIIE family protein phosphatase, partial [Treponema sp.]|nr:SpoIIE family protein phosphatase [Treponema sp.]
SAIVSYRKDTVAPKAPKIKPIELDENNLSTSNTFSIEWLPDPEDNDIDGYTWSLQYVDSIPSRLAVNSRHPLRLSSEEVKELTDSLYEKNSEKIEKLKEPPRSIRGESLTLNQKIQNARNGLYVFSVAAIDDVGNIGDYDSIVFIMNKYIPQTYITTVNLRENIFGDIELEIYGGGFTYEGTISEVYIDLDGEAPYDYVLTQENGDFKVESDNRISGINIKVPKANDYYIGLLHTDRGLYLTKEKVLDIKDYGTVKGNKTFSFIPKWLTDLFHGKFSFDLSFIIILLMIIFAVVAIVMITRGLTGTAREAVLIQAEIKALIQGDIMPEERKKQTENLKRKGSGLRLKLTAYTMTLILILVLTLISALGYIMYNREEQTRAEGLGERVNVILDAMSSGAKINLPNAASNLLALSDLTEESEALSDANFAVITGRGNNTDDINLDYIWATNDADVTSKINTDSITYGTSRFIYDHIDEIADECLSLNKEAAQEVDFIAAEISELTAEGIMLAGKDDEESIARRTEISDITTQLNNRVNRALDDIATKGIGSYPKYDSTKIDKDNTTFLFYKPVLYRHGSDQTYVNGIVLVEVSTESLVQDMKDAKMAIIKLASAVVAAGLLLGLIFALLLSSIIVGPVNKLARHVAMIRDTEDKEKLAGKDIVIKSRDEIGMLGDTINEMTHGLVEAAIQSKNLTFGKEVQSKFIPLQTDELGNSLTYGQLQDTGIELFSYYAGADELSGDYFDYKQLDKNHYAIIKCDVSGHGVPAALIMVEVATLFLNAFSNWSMKNPAQGTNLKPVVGQINDLIESRGFKGRFAAFTLAILNTQSGECWFCNAGDNLVHVYDGNAMKNKTVTLPETPAAGMFSTDLVDIKGGYKVAKFTLKKDDVLFLYTDGIEEAKRNFRNQNDEIIPCAEKGLNENDIHKNHKVGETNEELSPERVSDIIECVYSRGIYKLEKMHNANQSETFTFDFSTCSGTAEESIIALVSIEKVFRMYRSKNTTQENTVLVDVKIDEFLKQHFVEYSVYCLNHKEIENDKTHILYCGLMEDPQYDDLTLIAIKKT